MTPGRFNECLKQIDWSLETLAENLGCDESLVEAYSLGTDEVPLELASWLETLAQVRAAPGSLDAMLGPIVDVKVTARSDEQHALVLDIELLAVKARLATVERENRILLQTVRKTEYYLERYLEPGRMSAVECIDALLTVVDNDEINEVTNHD